MASRGFWCWARGVMASLPLLICTIPHEHFEVSTDKLSLIFEHGSHLVFFFCPSWYSVRKVRLFGRNSQALSSSGVGPGSGSQGKDPLAPAMQSSRNMYQHPAVTGYNPQDARAQALPVTVNNSEPKNF